MQIGEPGAQPQRRREEPSGPGTREAGVSPESIYQGFGSKAGLAKAVFDTALAGDDEPVPIAERPAQVTVRAELDRYAQWLGRAITCALCP